MTSSLVGSEMCIRDSVCSELPIAIDACLRRVVRRAEPALRANSPVVSVSYTHLTLPTICSV
eukprot:23702-Prorocentrum_lima.AAC.1